MPYRGFQYRTFVHVVPEGDDATLYSTRRSIRNTWKNPCPLNLKWDLVESSRENVELAIEMLERDRRMKKERNYEKAPRMMQAKLDELNEILKAGVFPPAKSSGDGDSKAESPSLENGASASLASESSSV